MKKTLVAAAATAMLSLPLGLAHATPPDNRPPADRGNRGHGQSQQQQQNQQQGQCQAIIIVLGSCAGEGALPGMP